MEAEKIHTEPVQADCIKLTKNSRGYNWEIRILREEMTDSAWVNRINELDKQFRETYGDLEL